MKAFKLKDCFNGISVKSGEKFTIEMETTPSTGHNWSVEVISGTLRELKKEHALTPIDNTIGGTSTLKMAFQVHKNVEPGDFSLVLSHGRSWESNPDKVVPIKVKVI